MSRSLSFLVSSRGNYRGQINRIYSELADLATKSAQERNVLSSKLQRIKGELFKLDPQIRDLKWIDNLEDETKAQQENDDEMKESLSYEDKITECLFALSQVTTNVTPVNPLSSSQNPDWSTRLKSVTAPLPIYSSAPEEDLPRFLPSFRTPRDGSIIQTMINFCF